MATMCRHYRALWEECRDCGRTISSVEAALAAAERRAEEAERALGRVNEIRNSIIGCQTVNWSEHVYPLVAALDEAGLEGAPYPENRANVGTMLERTLAAESRATSLASRVSALEGALRQIVSECRSGSGQEAVARVARAALSASAPGDAREDGAGARTCDTCRKRPFCHGAPSTTTGYVIAGMAGQCRAWMAHDPPALRGGEIVGGSIADPAAGSIVHCDPATPNPEPGGE